MNPARGGDDGVRRRNALQAHAELFNDALSDPQDRLAKLANVVEALVTAAQGRILSPLTVQADHAAGAIVLESARRQIELWWASGDAPALAQAALERQVDVLIVVQGFPYELTLADDLAARLVLLDGRDLALLLEGRWSFGQALRFKLAAQQTHARFTTLPVAPPADVPAEPESSFGPDDGDVLPANLDQMPTDRGGEDAGRVDNPSVWDVGGAPQRPAAGDEMPSTVTSNVEAHERLFEEEQAFEEAERRRLRRLRGGIALLAVLGVLIVIFGARLFQSAEQASLDQAADVALQASRLEFDVYRTLETGGLRTVFDETLAQAIEAQTQELRVRGVHLEGDLNHQVLDSRIQGDQAGILVRQSGEIMTRRTSDGQTIQRGQMDRAVGFVLSRSADDRWRVTQRAPVG